MYLTQERSYERKIKEVFIALKIDRELTKDELLEDYLNTIYFGRGAYGIQAAVAGVLRQERRRPHRGRERAAGGADPEPGLVRRPRQRRRPSGPLRLRARRHGHRGLAVRRRPRRAGAPGDPRQLRRRPVRRSVGLPRRRDAERADPARVHRGGDPARRAARPHDVRAEGAGGGRGGDHRPAPAGGGVAGELPRRAGRGAAGHRRGGRDLRRARLPGRRVLQRRDPGCRAAGLDVQAVRAGRRARRTRSASATASTAPTTASSPSTTAGARCRTSAARASATSTWSPRPRTP